ncbi:uncharacterized protein A4U43_C05F31120 [Asparagus officinalis]|uniref:Uncharacterized protein n=1 Tax=Asparagus officinalis TaxID=4686 RepID=A0A5P1EXK8_ASPOF|nr:uncharacterized protein A4U43_C05F31120 [Asparagus officinalis]
MTSSNCEQIKANMALFSQRSTCVLIAAITLFLLLDVSAARKVHKNVTNSTVSEVVGDVQVEDYGHQSGNGGGVGGGDSGGFKICRDCYMDAKENGNCPGCKEQYRMGDYEDEVPNFAQGAPALPAPGSGMNSNKSLQLRSQNADFDHNRWIFETKGTYGYGNAYWPKEGSDDEDDIGDGIPERAHRREPVEASARAAGGLAYARRNHQSVPHTDPLPLHHALLLLDMASAARQRGRALALGHVRCLRMLVRLLLDPRPSPEDQPHQPPD